MNPGCLFGPLLWLLGRDLQKAGDKADRETESPMGEGEINSGPGGYEGRGYSGGYAAEFRAEQGYFDEGSEH